MTDEEKWEVWRNKNAEIQKPYGRSVHKHIVWYEGVDRRKAFLDGLAEGRKKLEKENAELKAKLELSNKKGAEYIAECLDLREENAELKEKFQKASDETWTLGSENEELKNRITFLETQANIDFKLIDELQKQIEKMKCCGNCGNVRCTSKYRGNSAYHRQEDGYACADNEDWTPRLDNKK